MGKIALEGMLFFAHHGVTDEEQKTGNRFSVDIRIEADLTLSCTTDALEDTVDYGQIYGVVAEEMQIRSRLLEHVAQRIIRRVSQLFPSIRHIEVGVSKFNPPVGGVVHRSTVTIEERFHH